MNGLLIDDDETYARAMKRVLERRGIFLSMAHDSVTALAIAEAERPEFALVDLKLGKESGLALLAPLRELREDMRIIVVTGYASVATAVEAIKRGADNYLPKPVTIDSLLRVLRGETEIPISENMTPLRRIEWEHIQQALVESEGNISATARLLGMHRRSLQRKLAKRPTSDSAAEMTRIK